MVEAHGMLHIDESRVAGDTVRLQGGDADGAYAQLNPARDQAIHAGNYRRPLRQP